MLLMIDNYDSFVHNLARYFGELGRERRVIRNDAISVKEVRALNPQAILLSPGPCTPAQAGISLELVRNLAGKIPMLGVCLGHQAIAESFGGRLRRALQPRHGKTSLIRHDAKGIFTGLPNPLRAGRYHSLAVEIPPSSPLEITGRAEDNEIMGLAHRTWPIYGVQFHPESILTEKGHDLLANFLRLADEWNMRRDRNVLLP